MADNHPMPRSDVIIVPGHKLLHYLNRRVDKAIDLYQAGYAGALLLCGGNSEAEYMAARARKAAIPEAAIMLESESTTTLENALYSAAIIGEQQWRSAIIVSDAYHFARLKLCFRRSGLENIQLIRTPFPNKITQQCQWLLALLREALAIPYYLVKTSGLKTR